MKIVLAIDSFKGSIDSLDGARAAGRGILRVMPQAQLCELAVADGGEGLIAALVGCVGGEVHKAEVTDPLGTPVEAAFGILPDGTAVIEMAAASGLPLVPPEKRDPRVTTTRGTGELIAKALDMGARRFLIGIGGSATNDGGVGMARALGVAFKDAQGRELGEGGGELCHLAQVDMTGLDERLAECRVTVACDVTNPLCGENGASMVFSPQKGATPEMARALDAGMVNFARVLREQYALEVDAVPGAGAAGGLGAGLLAFLKAEMRPGIDLVLETIGLEAQLQDADLVFTGEGRMDATSARGKTPAGVAALAKKHGVPVIALTGCLGAGYEALYEIGVDAVLPIADGPMTLEQSMENAALLLERAAERAMRLYRLGIAGK